MGRLLIATAAAGAGLLLASCAAQGGTPAEVAEEDYRVSVEIPLDAMRVAEGGMLKVDELLGERTSFDAEDFLLDEVVLIARSNGDAEANVELLVVEWRSGQVAIPAGGDDDWYEVRLPAPEEDLGGAWLLDIVGDATVDLVVAVLEPRPRLVSEARTVYRTTTVYRPARAVREVFWIYDPGRYYVYHYYGVWPYRYFIGPWSYRYYDLAYRPHRHHYGPLYRPAHWRDRARRHRHVRRHDEPAAPRPPLRSARRIAPELVQLRRTHPRLRALSRLSRLSRIDETPRRSPPRRQAQTSASTEPEPRAQRGALQRAGATASAQRSQGGSRTLRRPGASRQARTTARTTTEPPVLSRSARPARSAADAPSRARTTAAPRTARQFERSPTAAGQAPRPVRRGDPPAATRTGPTSRASRPGATRSVPTSRPQRTATRRANVQSSRPTGRDRASAQPRSPRLQPTARSQRSARPQRTEPRRPDARAQRSAPPSRTRATPAAPVRRAQAPRAVRERVERAPRRVQPPARPTPAQRPARSTRQAAPDRAADDAPASSARSRRFERR